MSLEWIIPLISAIGACVAFFLSKPERLWFTYLAIFCVVFAGGWEASRVHSDLKAKHELQASIERRLIRQTDSLLDFISDMVLYASGGWLPKTEEEFFSSTTARLICSEMDISTPASVVPAQPWGGRIYKVFRDYKETIRTTLDQHAIILDSELITVLDEVDRTQLLNSGVSTLRVARADSQIGVRRPPLLCWGLEPLVEESLDSLLRLFRILKEREEDAGFSPNRQWLVFPENLKKKFLGESRFSLEDLQDWQKRYPNSPGPANFGRGDPRKGIVPHNNE